MFDDKIHAGVSLHFIKHACTAWLSVKTIRRLPSKNLENKDMPMATADPSSSKIIVLWSSALILSTNSEGTGSLKKPKQFPEWSKSIPPTPEWLSGS